MLRFPLAMELSAFLPVECPLTRAEYDDLVRRGVLDEANVELLHGRIVSMSPHGKGHRIGVRRCARVLIRALGERAAVDIQSSFAVSDDSEPEPDIVVLPPGDEVDASPREAFLVIEVSDSSLRRDRGIKAPLYASAGVPEYWIVDVVHEGVEVYSTPSRRGYVSSTRHSRGASIRVPGFPDVLVLVDDILPPRRP